MTTAAMARGVAPDRAFAFQCVQRPAKRVPAHVQHDRQLSFGRQPVAGPEAARGDECPERGDRVVSINEVRSCLHAPAKLVDQSSSIGSRLPDSRCQRNEFRRNRVPWGAGLVEIDLASSLR